VLVSHEDFEFQTAEWRASEAGTTEMQDPLIPVVAGDFKSTRQCGGIRPCNGMANSLCRERIVGFGSQFDPSTERAMPTSPVRRIGMARL
jgi:hypothetical protein